LCFSNLTPHDKSGAFYRIGRSAGQSRLLRLNKAKTLLLLVQEAVCGGT